MDTFVLNGYMTGCRHLLLFQIFGIKNQTIIEIAILAVLKLAGKEAVKSRPLKPVVFKKKMLY